MTDTLSLIDLEYLSNNQSAVPYHNDVNNETQPDSIIPITIQAEYRTDTNTFYFRNLMATININENNKNNKIINENYKINENGLQEESPNIRFKYILGSAQNITFGYGNKTISKGWLGMNKQTTLQFDSLEDIGKNSGISSFGKAQRALNDTLKKQIHNNNFYNNDFNNWFNKQYWPDITDDKKMALYLMYLSKEDNEKISIETYIKHPLESTTGKLFGKTVRNKAVPPELSGFTKGGRSRKQRRHKGSSTKRRR